MDEESFSLLKRMWSDPEFVQGWNDFSKSIEDGVRYAEQQNWEQLKHVWFDEIVPKLVTLLAMVEQEKNGAKNE